jgi:hypothetical protein
MVELAFSPVRLDPKQFSCHGGLPGHVHSGKMLHAALLHLMLEAVQTDLVSPSA